MNAISRIWRSFATKIALVYASVYGLFVLAMFGDTWPQYVGKGLDMPLWILAPYFIIGFLGGGRFLQWFHGRCKPRQHCITDVCSPRECALNCTTNHCMRYIAGFLVPLAIFWLPALIIFTIGWTSMVVARVTAKFVMWVSVPAYAKAHPIRTPKAATQPQVMPATDLKTLHTEVFGSNKPEIVKMIEGQT